ncbi:MAG: DUF5657 family protein [Candidatus Gottesmanbacteria bacterium]
MNPNQYTTIGFLITKVLTIIALLLYTIYAGIMYRQEHLMSKVLAETSEAVLRILVIVHFCAALFVVLLAIILL